MSFVVRHVVPWIKVALAQLLGLACLLLARDFLPGGALASLLLVGVTASLAGRVLGLSIYWIPIQLLLPFAVVYSAVIPAWVYLAGFVLCALVFWNSATGQVPLYLTNTRTWAAIEALARQSGVRTFIDLGSGSGGGVVFLARANPELDVTGVETAPLVYLLSRLRVAVLARKNARIRYKSIWREDLAPYDLVYCFLSPVPMPQMYRKARKEMRPGTLFVSNSFTVPGHPPDRIVDVPDGRKTRLHIWKM